MPLHTHRDLFKSALLLTVLRFPVPVAISILLMMVGNADIAGLIDLKSYDWREPGDGFYSEQLYAALISGFLASGAVQLYCEKYQWRKMVSALLAFTTACGIAILLLIPTPQEAQYLFLLPGLVLAVMVAGYVHKAPDDNAIWIFNARLAFAVLASGLVAGVFVAGVLAVLESFSYLFDIVIQHNIHRYVWTTAASLIAPIVGLSLVSRNLSETFSPDGDPSLLSTGTSLVLNFLLIPLALTYLIILYFYAGRILIEAELPKGQVGIMVLIFTVGGAAIWLIAHPWRQTGSRLIKFFDRIWFPSLAVPLILLATGTYQRISEYGVTPERYGLAAIGIWAGLLIVWYLLRSRSVQPRILVGTLSAILIAASFGPWSATSISVASQYQRLISLMQTAGYFDGDALKVPDNIETSVSNEAHSKLDFLARAGQLELISPLFEGRADNPFKNKTPGLTESILLSDRKSIGDILSDAFDVLKFEPYGHDSSKIWVEHRETRPVVLKTQEMTFYSGTHTFHDRGSNVPEADRMFDIPQISSADNKITISYQNHIWERDVAVFLQSVLEAQSTSEPTNTVILTIAGKSGDAKVVFHHLSGYLDGNNGIILNGSASLFLSLSSDPDH
ncbi:MAG: DUF4153 domain-containing protein [Stappiaceae bacterium]